MNSLHNQVKAYLETLDFSFLEESPNSLVADKIDTGGARDIRLIWVIPDTEDIDLIQSLERHILNEFREKSLIYPNSRGWVIPYSLSGVSTEFRAKAAQYNLMIRVPIQFFDTDFKVEISPNYLSTIKDLRVPPPRIPQPYSVWKNGQSEEKGEDLLETLWNEFLFSDTPRLRVIVGPAGIGKTYLFRALFSRLYQHFLDKKNQQETFPRPVPLIPVYLRKAGILRTRELVRSFVDTEIASPVGLPTFEWLVTQGYTSWLFDGLDELYAEDSDFFQNLVDILTRPTQSSNAHMLVCARESLLTTCEPFVEFINDYIDEGDNSLIKIYKVEGWEQNSKRAFARLHFDAPRDNEFLTYISKTDSLKQLSQLPYYCDLLRQAHEQAKLSDFTDPFSLLDYAIREIIEREKAKGVLNSADFIENGLNEWLETTASEFYGTGFKGVNRLTVEAYGKEVLSKDLSQSEQQDAITTLVQFPLFAPGAEAGYVTFQHELVAEYLAGRFWFARMLIDPLRVANAISDRVDFSDLLIAKYIAAQLSKNPEQIRNVLDTLRLSPPTGRAFTNLLELLLMASPESDLLLPLKNILEGRDLSHVEFENRNLQGFSFRNCDLTNTVFLRTSLKGAKFEGARILNTKFEKLESGALDDADFADLVHFESAIIKDRVDSRTKFAEWLQKQTGQRKLILEPCPSAVQLRTLFLKFVRPDGSGRRDDLPYKALVAGKRHLGGPNPEDVVQICISRGYLQDTRWHDRIRRVPGDKHNEMIHFVKDWILTENLRAVLDELCERKNCEHIPRVT